MVNRQLRRFVPPRAIPQLSRWSTLVLLAFVLAARSTAAPPDDKLPAPIEDRSAEHLYELGRRAQRGLGTGVDMDRAMSLFQQAAKLGSANAAFSLGNLYLLGEGVPADETLALSYYRQAADQGHVLAARNFQELQRAMKQTAPETEPIAENEDPERAILVEELSASSDDERRAIELARAHGMVVVLGDGTVLQGTVPDTGIPGPRSADAIEFESDSRDETTATQTAEETYRLAEQYFHGDGIEKDEAMAITLYRAAAGGGHPLARRKLNAIYQAAGLPVPEFDGAAGRPPPP